MQNVEVQIYGSYVYEKYVLWKSCISIICTSAFIHEKFCHFLKFKILFVTFFKTFACNQNFKDK